MNPKEALADAQKASKEKDIVTYVDEDPFGDVGDYCTYLNYTHTWKARCYPGGRVELMPDFQKLLEVTP